KRSGKIFIDYFRNYRGATTVAAYSVRAREHAPVSTPLSWEELSPRIHSAQYTLNNLRRRLALLKHDPWERFYKIKQTLPFF
ncbi:MAG: DNA ligase, partial [Gammaproteobacteria bacterium]